MQFAGTPQESSDDKSAAQRAPDRAFGETCDRRDARTIALMSSVRIFK